MEHIDQDLYNRQIYVIGNQAMLKLSKSNVLLVGVGSLGIEIAKNIVLAGIGSLTIIDNNTCQSSDSSTQFFINSSHIDKKSTRAEASLEQLQQLNPYVRININKSNLSSLNESELTDLLISYQCVVLTELKSMSYAIKINEICRKNNVNFIMSDVSGLFGWSFSDFNQFEVVDTDGEEYKEQLIGNITSENNQIIIETLDKRLHDLETNDFVELNEIKGLNELNQQKFKVTALNPFKFSLETTLTNDLSAYKTSGYFKKVKIQKKIQFESLNAQLTKPTLLISELSEHKFLNPYLVHVALHALNIYFENSEKNTFSDYLCILNDLKLKFEQENKMELKNLDEISKIVYFTRNSVFPPLCAFFGGLVGQEVLKSITNKFTPIVQFLNLDYFELFESKSESTEQIEKIYSNLIKNDQYDNLRLCFGGETTVNKLKESKLFMVGCGAIGCEMLKNYAMLGISTGNNGYISITDNDLIEKSNLNRQFLFRQHDIQKSKSVAATSAVLKMNPNLKIKTYEKKVCVQTEAELFNDNFFQAHDVCVNALDNLEARRYMDNRCVSNQKPLLESGTLGPKGHVQVIIPHITESYNSQRDPVEADIPYCTLKSFPSNIDHCIQWARDKFESTFTLKPTMFEKFLKDIRDKENLEFLVKKLRADENLVIEGLILFVKMIRNYCYDWKDCLLLGRKKFEKFFPNKAKNLLHHYPLDHLMKDGSHFWKSPKRPPHAIKFDSNNKMHLDFVLVCARLFSEQYGVTQDNQVNVKEFLDLNEDKIPMWAPKNKHIETDETKKKEETVNTNTKDLNNNECAQILENFLSKSVEPKVTVINFEKDYEPNGHIEFIYLTSNLRAHMYSIDQTDKLTCKKIAGKIIPAIATTTSCIAGLATVELVKILQNTNWSLDMFRNVFLNLGISFMLLSEPGACAKSKIAENCYVSLWDKWSISGNKTFTLKNFIESVSSKYNLTVSGVMQGAKPIYIPVLPGHVKRLNETMLKLLKGVTNVANLNEETLKNEYVDLFLTYKECDEDQEKRDQNNLCPPIRYWFLS